MSKIYKFNYHWLNELSKHKDKLDNDTGILVTYIEVLQQENKQLKEDKKKAIDFIDNWKKYKKDKGILEVSMLDLLYIKEILGDKE